MNKSPSEVKTHQTITLLNMNWTGGTLARHNHNRRQNPQSQALIRQRQHFAKLKAGRRGSLHTQPLSNINRNYEAGGKSNASRWAFSFANEEDRANLQQMRCSGEPSSDFWNGCEPEDMSLAEGESGGLQKRKRVATLREFEEGLRRGIQVFEGVDGGLNDGDSEHYDINEGVDKVEIRGLPHATFNYGDEVTDEYINRKRARLLRCSDWTGLENQNLSHKMRTNKSSKAFKNCNREGELISSATSDYQESESAISFVRKPHNQRPYHNLISSNNHKHAGKPGVNKRYFHERQDDDRLSDNGGLANEDISVRIGTEALRSEASPMLSQSSSSCSDDERDDRQGEAGDVGEDDSAHCSSSDIMLFRDTGDHSTTATQSTDKEILSTEAINDTVDYKLKYNTNRGKTSRYLDNASPSVITDLEDCRVKAVKKNSKHRPGFSDISTQRDRIKHNQQDKDYYYAYDDDYLNINSSIPMNEQQVTRDFNEHTKQARPVIREGDLKNRSIAIDRSKKRVENCDNTDTINNAHGSEYNKFSDEPSLPRTYRTSNEDHYAPFNMTFSAISQRHESIHSTELNSSNYCPTSIADCSPSRHNSSEAVGNPEAASTFCESSSQLPSTPTPRGNPYGYTKLFTPSPVAPLGDQPMCPNLDDRQSLSSRQQRTL